ncbi:hypothetical protein F2P44_06115 [Massilia sp. CCM 8695]|uniref:Uncharacterized protein n=1 Tax=Massilia frigida TaxID=2609281 RepID=A0ABX0N0Q1_9BURK|nr:hypothetical protein [Massilia frigida]
MHPPPSRTPCAGAPWPARRRRPRPAAPARRRSAPPAARRRNAPVLRSAARRWSRRSAPAA